jgi:hypothetical protein
MSQFPFPFPGLELSKYAQNLISDQVSVSLLFYSYLLIPFLAIAFSMIIYSGTKKLAAFYLLLTSICFGFYSYLDLITWLTGARFSMFSSSILCLFKVLVFIFSYWFLYSFIKNQDLPRWQKICSVFLFLSTIISAFLGSDLNTYDIITASSVESSGFVIYDILFQGTLLVGILFFILSNHRVATLKEEKQKIIIAGIGVFVMLFILYIAPLAANFVETSDLFSLKLQSKAHNVTISSLFGMPIFLIFIGYLIEKYEAFDLKVTTPVGLVIALMILMFIGLVVV